MWVILAYLIAAAAALITGWLLRGQHPLLVAGAADAAATVVIFAFSVIFDNSSFYDPYWSVVPLPLAIYFSWAAGSQAPPLARQLLLYAPLLLWGARLTWNWARGWSGLDHEDWRYINLRKTSGKAYWLVSFTGIHFFPTALVFGGMLPVWAALSTPGRPLGPLDVGAALVTLAAVLIEATADQQLRRFRLRPNPQPGETLESGLWATSRHPNYFGEVLFWWGLWLQALAAVPQSYWTGAGALAMTALFLFISIPMIDRRMLERRPNYRERIARVSMLVPWFPKK
jgi:steroid 5-alpha reductase family enzyme